MRGRRQGVRARGSLRQLALPFAALLLTFAILSGLGRANGRYFYCEAMGLMATDPCASAGARDERDVAPATEARRGHADCCEVVILSSLPRVAMSASSAVPPPPLVTVLPAAPLPDGLPGASRARPDRAFEPWRTRPRSAAQARAQLMVFLT